ncbi:DegT/DnrJ/EryC1/StrS family aminotransferase [Anaerosoma tenue]|uniref:DegT/DnrJ/EryC1/StrS family aminotransferase n=1 Tax=Anaerosoma tenue TaxID=2933588 RepID=UPI0022608CAF|nr:DegT/DnrJ/EryC1/StrS family aminotransferase [Anaerosoma tenue]MCK8114595.1 DegT/DnrJ/EryC1/StrS family aminotransferase [Anaerosoma tenue]
MGVPLLDLKAQYRELQAELDAAIGDVMANAAFIGGPKVKGFEEAVAGYCGTTYAVACGNGTDALFLIMAAMGIGKGDEVITTPFTFWATVECIRHVGATPVFVDIEPGTYNMDVSQIEAAITPRTKAILPVHIFGQCVDMDPLLEIAERHGIAVIEDACQAIGATYKGKRAGSLAHAAAFSFFPSKNLGAAGDGGMITTDDADLAARARKLASHGTSKKYFHDAFGTNSRLDALQAAILLVKLPHLDRWNGERRAAAAVYGELLAGVDGLELPVARDFGDAVYHLYIVKTESAEAAETVMGALKEAGIGTALYYPLALHEQEAFDHVDGFVRPSLPMAESCDARTFALPCFPGITREQQEEVVAVVRRALAGA